jgi:phenylacetate-CoA ligase
VSSQRARDGALLLRWLVGRPAPSRDEILAFQTRRLRRLVEHAYRSVPYYRRLFDRHGLEPGDVRELSDLASIPVSSRSDLQACAAEELTAVPPERLLATSTSGSSGRPLTIRRTVRERRLLGALRVAAMHEAGLRMRDRCATITAVRPRDPRDTKRLLGALYRAGLYRSLRVSGLEPLEGIARTLQEFRPHVLNGFPGVISRLVPLIGGRAGGFRTRLVTPGGEVLTPSMRAQIAEGFGARVVDFYASHEFNLIASECPPTGNYHVCDAGLIVEVVRDHRPVAQGERGEVVATALHSFAMPFLRYRLGDLVTRGPEPCACGCPHATLRAIQGRMIDYFPLADGRLLHPYEITGSLLAELGPWVRQYQLTQETEDRIVLRVVPASGIPAERLNALEAALGRILGPGVRGVLAIVPEIELEPSGKFRVSRSRVRSEYDGTDWSRA